jgi:histidine triad (HIT) family protein
MIDSPIDLNTESGDPHFENETMVAVKSNNLKHNTMIGSYVIIPKSEVSSPFDLTDKEWSDSRELLLKVKKYIDETYKPDGYNIGWNVGAVAGQSVAHAHMHIIPRYADEPLAGKGIRSWFKQPENIRASLKDNK